VVPGADTRAAYLAYPSAVAATAVHLVLADGTRLTATDAGEDDKIFSGSYYFTVPADVATATLSVDTYRAEGMDGYAGFAATITLTGFTIPLALDAPPVPVPAVTTPATVLQLTNVPDAAATQTGVAGAANPFRPTTSAGLWLLLVLVAAAVAVLAVLRRRRPPAPQPAALGQRGWMVPPPPTRPPVPPNTAPRPSTAPPSAVPGSPPSTPPTVSSPSVAPPATMTMPSRPNPPSPPDAAATNGNGRSARPPVLVPIPTRSEPVPAGLLYFEVLGPLRITGWPDGQARSGPVVELATYLAFHPGRTYTTDELRDPLSVGKARALEGDTIRTYASSLRRAVGIDHLPDAGRKGYALAGFDTDWQRFIQYTNRKTDGDQAGQAAALADALALIRGLPFTDLPANGLGWVATELLVSQIEVAVIDAASQLIELALVAGDWPLAAWASDCGLIVSPTAQDLNVAALRAAHLSGHPDRFGQAWRDLGRRFAAAKEPIPAEVQQLHAELRQRAVASPDT